MPVFLLGEEPIFPPAQLANEDGVIAIGGDLSPSRLLNAYAAGIFPWYSKGEPILWWSPNPRLVLLPGDLHVSKSMQKIFRKKAFHLTTDYAFEEVLKGCALPRPHQPGTWLTKEMEEAYIRLHRLGYAHSVEAWEGDPEKDKQAKLAGGLYGVSLGKGFFGESMFALTPNASKYAFIALASTLFENGFTMIDCQVPTDHLKRMGAREIPRIEFLALLQETLKHETLNGEWNFQLLSKLIFK